jgi:polyisoprenoid-binding protein YceI
MGRPFIIALVFSISACDESRAGDRPAAGIASAVQGIQAVSGRRYNVSSSGSNIKFLGAKVTGKHEGGFGAFQGTIELVENDPNKSSVTVEVDVASLTSDAPKLTTHLKSPDWLDVEKYPKARFTSTSIRHDVGPRRTHTVTGNLELHGVTKSIDFPATIRVGESTLDVDSEFTINRQQFGIKYPGMPDDLIKDEVTLTLQLHATPS